MRTFCKMLKIEGMLSIRDMNMPIFAIAMPVVVQIILGIIYGDRAAFEGAQYTFLEQSFGALCSIAICAGGLMGLPIVISEYRERRILKRFQVTPVSPQMLLFVQLCIYALYATASVAVLWMIEICFWGFQMRGSVLVFLGGWLLVLISILSIGMLVGGVARNSKSASVIASALYFPMLIFSGATLPYEVMPRTMQKIVDIFPLTQGIKLLKTAVLGQPLEQSMFSILMILAVAGICIGISIRFFRWE
ncbi:MAG: ABC transporter permease [Lachnospiraceae bacterium]|nr:ABC transporter permease [Lachnospiraceae bacterium]